jgi:pilus assembly protein Flp/PilA
MIPRLLRRFSRDECGATGIEYGLIATLVSAAIISSVSMVGCKLNQKFTVVAEALE